MQLPTPHRRAISSQLLAVEGTAGATCTRCVNTRRPNLTPVAY